MKNFCHNIYVNYGSKTTKLFKAVFIISKKNIPLAVNRNLMKRRIRSVLKKFILGKLIEKNCCFSFIVKKSFKVNEQCLLDKILNSLAQKKKKQKCLK